ncbi:GNAT acetyltransferase [compost metagenome]
MEHIIPGFVYADPDGAHTFLIGTDSGLLYVFGDEKSSTFHDELVELYWKRVNEGERFTLFSSSQKWNEVLQERLSNEVSIIRRYAFSYRGDVDVRHRSLLPPDFTIQRIDGDMIHKSIEFQDDYYAEYWGSVSNFLKNGLGFCVAYKGKVVSECTSIFKSENFAEIDIATHSDFRGKGLALAAAQAFIDYCTVNNITPCWDCDVDNISSIKLAEKMGFTEPVTYSIIVKKRG